MTQGTPPMMDPHAIAIAPPPGGGVFEWLTLRGALADAEGRIRDVPRVASVRLERARAAAELAARALDPIYPLPHGSGVTSAVTLARDALFWALAAQIPEHSPETLAEAFALSQREALVRAAGGEARFCLLIENLVERSFVEIAEAPLETQRELAGEALRFVAAIVHDFEAGARAVSSLRFRRLSRLVILLGVLIAAAFTGTRAVERLRLGPDIAAGKPWRASSAYAGFAPEAHTCDGNDTKILFHTNEEQNPWYEVDLGAPRKVKAVEVRNRSDGFAERAIPLAIEVSDDRVTWTEVGQRMTSFETWRLGFSPRNARYVRARSLRRTWLHLERVAVF